MLIVLQLWFKFIKEEVIYDLEIQGVHVFTKRTICSY